MNALTNVIGLRGDLRFDLEVESWLTASGKSVRLNQLSNKLELHHGESVIPMTDERLAEIRFSFKWERNGQEPAKDKIIDALALIGERRAYHPVRDYLRRLRWDGVRRLDTWLIRFAGAEDTELHRAFGRKMLCAAVKRVFEPGCKFDHVLVLQGRQDLGKSSLIRALCNDPGWFSDQAKIGADARETIERTAGSWILELAELDGLSKREANAVKSFITTVIDRARGAYGHYVTDKPRQFVLFGTTNENAFLTDVTGNRRWWPVLVTCCDVAGLTAERDQLWAEAVAAMPSEKLWLDTDGLKDAAAASTGAVIDHGPWFEILSDTLPDGPMKTSVIDAWKLVGIERDGINRVSPAMRLNLRKAMAGLGFEPETKNVRRDGRQVRAFVRGSVDHSDWWPYDSRSEGGNW